MTHWWDLERILLVIHVSFSVSLFGAHDPLVGTGKDITSNSDVVQCFSVWGTWSNGWIWKCFGGL